LELALIIWLKIRPTSTTKNTEEGIARFNFVKSLKRCAIGDDFAQGTIYEEGGNKKDFIPEF
jgi:hypothetical protein